MRWDIKKKWNPCFLLALYCNHTASAENMEHPFLNETFTAWLSFSYPFILYARAVIPKKLKTFPFTETEVSTKSSDAEKQCSVLLSLHFTTTTSGFSFSFLYLHQLLQEADKFSYQFPTCL